MKEEVIENGWFQQDSTTAHTVWRSMNVMRQMFPGRLIYRGGDIAWPSLSSFYFTQCDFCEGFLEGRGVQVSPKEPARPEASNTHGNPTHTSRNARSSP